MELVTVDELFEFGETQTGIFSLMQNPPWSDADISAILDAEYFLFRSASKFVSPGTLRLFDFYTVQSDAKTAIAAIILSKYRDKWTRLWEVNESEYNPIHNYDMTENETDGVIETNARNGSVNNTNTRNRSVTGHEQDYVFGFNSQSSDRNPSSRYESQNGDNLSENLAEISSQNDNHNKNETRQLTRSGNIGVTTTQQMLQAEIELWQWNFIEQVLADTDEFMTIPFYDPCLV